MKKSILKNILMGSLIALVVMTVLVFSLQIAISKNEAANTSSVRIEDAKQIIIDSEAEIAELTESLNEDYISKANAFAEMIKLNPEIIEDADELERIREMMNVDELHVTDDKGVIWWGTIPDYFGFDFATSEQTKPFLPILEDDTLEMAQEPQPSGTEGKLFQYISVPRRDSKGIVQIGMEPVRLSDALADSQIDVSFADITVGKEGTMFAVNKEDLTFAAFYDEQLIGTQAADVGIDESMLKKAQKSIKRVSVNGETFYSSVTETDDYYIGTLIPFSEVIGKTIKITFIVFLMEAIVITILAIIVNNAVNKNIIKGMLQIDSDINKIRNGESDVRVNVRTCEEFRVLSDGINSMLESIESKMGETEHLNSSMEHLIDNISEISESINEYSKEMQEVSRKISDGSSSQAATVEELSATFLTISKEVNDNADSAKHANDISIETRKQLKQSSEKMEQMQQSMEKISTASQKISHIVKTIDDIAFQTNILALNAAVEAARAGAAGKGFSVVADEVRNLANKSAEAAKGTTSLIDETLIAVEHGAVIANESAAELAEMMESVSKSTQIISEISEATTHQAKAINEVVGGMNQISNVVQNNSEISYNAQETAKQLDVEADKLNSMIHQHR